MIFFLPCTYSPWVSSTRVRSFIGDGSARVHKTRSRGRHARKRETGRGTRDRGDEKSSGRGAGTAPSIKTNNAFAAVIILFYSFAVISKLFK